MIACSHNQHSSASAKCRQIRDMLWQARSSPPTLQTCIAVTAITYRNSSPSYMCEPPAAPSGPCIRMTHVVMGSQLSNKKPSGGLFCHSFSSDCMRRAATGLRFDVICTLLASPSAWLLSASLGVCATQQRNGDACQLCSRTGGKGRHRIACAAASRRGNIGA